MRNPPRTWQEALEAFLPNAYRLIGAYFRHLRAAERVNSFETPA